MYCTLILVRGSTIGGSTEKDRVIFDPFITVALSCTSLSINITESSQSTIALFTSFGQKVQIEVRLGHGAKVIFYFAFTV